MSEPQVRSSGEPEASFDKRKLPVPVQQPTADPSVENGSVLGRLARALFGWKAGSIRADLEVVLEAGASGETDFSPEERTLLKIFWACASAGSGTSWCRVPTSLPCSRTSRWANWSVCLKARGI